MHPMKAVRKPTDAELAILRVLWARGPSTVRQVAEDLGRDTGYTTALKLLQIMTEKRLVRRDESSRTHIYEAAYTQDQTSGSSSPICSTACSTGRPPSSSCRRWPRPRRRRKSSTKSRS